MSTWIKQGARSTGAAAIAALPLVACQDADPAGPARSEIALKSSAGGVACFAKKTLSERLEFASADRAGKILRHPPGVSMLNALPRIILLLAVFAAACSPATHTAHLANPRTDARAYLEVQLQQSGARTVGELLQRYPHRFDLSPRSTRDGSSTVPRNQLHREPIVIVNGVRVNPSLVWQMPLGEVSSVRLFRGAQAPAAHAAQAGGGVIMIETRSRVP